MGTMRKAGLAALAVGSVLALGGCNLGAKVVNYDTWPNSLAGLADLDGDDDLDVLTLGSGAGVFLNDGDGALTGEAVEDPDTPAVEGHALGDVDGDGDLDRVDMGGASVYLALGDGEGGFGEPQLIEQVSSVTTVGLGDVDGDDDLDLLTTSYTYGLQVRPGDGDGGFGSPTAFDIGSAEFFSAGDLEVVDLDDDGALDVVMTGLGFDDDGNQAFVDVLLGDGDGAFGPYELYPGADGATNGPGLSLGDVDEDGDLDAVTGNTFVEALSVLAGDGDGGFGPSVEVPTAGEPLDTALGDIDGDDHLDVVSVQLGRGAAVVHFGDGEGGFAESHDIDSGGLAASRVAVGDLDGDGRDDVVTGTNGRNGDGSVVGVSLNRLRGRQHG